MAQTRLGRPGFLVYRFLPDCQPCQITCRYQTFAVLADF
jgi:hypothetical protein